MRRAGHTDNTYHKQPKECATNKTPERFFRPRSGRSWEILWLPRLEPFLENTALWKTEKDDVKEISAPGLVRVVGLFYFVLQQKEPDTVNPTKQTPDKNASPPFTPTQEPPKARDAQALACHFSTPPSILRTLAQHEDEYVRRLVAAHPNLPIALLETLSQDPQLVVREGVAKNPKAPPALLELLAKEESGAVRFYVIQHPRAPLSVLEALSRNEKAEVRRGVAKHPKTPSSLLETLSQDKDNLVRLHVAENPNTPGFVVEKLSEDESELVRKEATKHPKVSLSVLRAIYHQNDPKVQALVRQQRLQRALRWVPRGLLSLGLLAILFWRALL